MAIVNIPVNFDENAFAKHYGLTPMLDMLNIGNGQMSIPRLPDLIDDDLLQFIAMPEPTIVERLEAAELMIDLLLDTQQETP
jgi:hypothetical protein